MRKDDLGRYDLDTFLARVEPNTEVFCLFGRGFPRSFYKAYVNLSGAWYILEDVVFPCPSDPVKQRARSIKRGEDPPAAFWGRVSQLAEYGCIERAAIRALLLRSRAFRKPRYGVTPENHAV